MTKSKQRALAAALVGVSAFGSMSANAFWGSGPFGMFPGHWGGPWSSPWYSGPSGYPYGGYGYPHGGYGVPYAWGAPHGWGTSLYAYPVDVYPFSVYPLVTPPSNDENP